MLFKTMKLFFALIRPFLKARAKNVKNFVGFLGYEKTRLFAFEIYWPLGAYWPNIYCDCCTEEDERLG